MKKLLKHVLRYFGYKIEKIAASNSMSEAIKKVKLHHIDINTFIDVGASNGMWTEQCMQHYPDSFYLLVEAQKVHQEALESFVKKHENTSYVLKAAGNKEGEIYFDATDPFGGLASEIPFHKNNIIVPVTTIDAEVSKKQLKPPYCIKLDTHGYEVPILQGASNTLSNTNLLIIEAYNFRIAHESLRFWELCTYLEKLGFLPFHIVDLTHREKDHALWQMDIFFLRAEHPIFGDNTYR